MRLRCQPGVRRSGGLLMFCAALSTTGLLLTVAPGTAVAAVTPSARVSSTVSASEKVASMSVLCKLPAGTQIKPGINPASLCKSFGAQPNNIVSGNCGDAALYLADIGSGIADFELAVDSYLGPISFGLGHVGWTNHHTGKSNSFNVGIHQTLNPESWNDVVAVRTGAGSVSGDMSGSVELENGLVCTILNPNDTENIT